MKKKYAEYKGLNLVEVGKEVGKQWEADNTFEQSLQMNEQNPSFIFYEGPPSANGQPGIHHVMSRGIKDIFCRYKTQKGFYVKRKAGWDTHGLPVELGVEKKLGITKEDIGKKISVAEYNKACREEVMRYKDMWDELTEKIGYWVDLSDPYITFKNEYIESLWFLLSEIYKKGLLYKGYTIQPYSPAAGTGLSSHELNLPGCYKDVKDTTIVGQFKVIRNEKSEFLFRDLDENIPLYFLAWTTTPWTLPSNTALAVGEKIEYRIVQTYNEYRKEKIYVILAEKRIGMGYFRLEDLRRDDSSIENINDFQADSQEYENDKQKYAPYIILSRFNDLRGEDLIGLEYEQLIPWVDPGEGAFRVIAGDYVTTEDGTGIVHIAPTFGADDDRVAKQAGVPPLFMVDLEGKNQPMVDRTGKFYALEDLDPEFVKNRVNVDLYKDFAGQFVKNSYCDQLTEQDETLDVKIAVMLKAQNKAFKIEKHIHNYPHCWRTNKPILYYPLDSWFIRTTAVKERMIELNKTINWKPESTGTGRFGNWLENLVDWNLSRSRYWGTPLPIWRTEEGDEELCIGSVAQLRAEIDKAVEAGFMTENPYKSENYEDFDLHRPYIDNVFLVSPNGKKMTRETDLIDVWFDSGAMPYAQYFYPKNNISASFPADFIAEGVDQTRGWFFTLHAIATMISDSVAFKTVISNGLVLDKNGNKMSKSLGNGIDPFAMIEKYGPDAVRWYMITNSQPWDNLKFDENGIDEIRRKFFGTLYNTYSFFALYANIDGFSYAEPDVAPEKRPEIDRWILSELNTLIKTVDASLDNYEPTQAGRAIANFVNDYLSNWYVRLCRRRFWHGDYSEDKISAYQTLYTCLETVAQLAAPIAPFYADRLFCDLNTATGRFGADSVHLTKMPVANDALIDKDLENRMQMAQQICSLTLSLRKKNNIRVRQPLQKIMIPVANQKQENQIKAVEDLIKSEVNIKEIEYLTEDSNKLVKKIKPNFKVLGPKFGPLMKAIGGAVAGMNQEAIAELERNRSFALVVNNETIELTVEDVEILTEDIPGWVVASENDITIALDVTITEPLYQEGIARDMVNRIQNLRKESGLEVTDKICLTIEQQNDIFVAINQNKAYICSETLVGELNWSDKLEGEDIQEVEISDAIQVRLKIKKI